MALGREHFRRNAVYQTYDAGISIGETKTVVVYKLFMRNPCLRQVRPPPRNERPCSNCLQAIMPLTSLVVICLALVVNNVHAAPPDVSSRCQIHMLV
jgi:hypothetical protein